MELVPKVNYPEAKKGIWEIKKFTVSKEDAAFFNLRCMLKGISERGIDPGTYTSLRCNGHLVMSDTPAERHDHREVVLRAEGDVLITGLGLGVVTNALLLRNEVKSLTVIEIEKDVIDLIQPLLPQDPRLTIINGDAYTWKPNGNKYNVIWHDIWPEYSNDCYRESIRLHRKFARAAKQPFWQGSWGREAFKNVRRFD